MKLPPTAGWLNLAQRLKGGQTDSLALSKAKTRLLLGQLSPGSSYIFGIET